MKREHQILLDPIEGVVQVATRWAYGRMLIEPRCAHAKRFAQLTKTATLTLGAIKLIKELGFVVKDVTPQWEPPSIDYDREAEMDVAF